MQVTGRNKNAILLESLVKILRIFPAAVLVVFLALPIVAADVPDPDGKPADMAKPVKVFIIMGQSNTLEMGGVAGDKEGKLEFAVKKESLYPFMVDDDGNWTTRKDVRNVHTMGSGGPGGRGGRQTQRLADRLGRQNRHRARYRPPTRNLFG